MLLLAPMLAMHAGHMLHLSPTLGTTRRTSRRSDNRLKLSSRQIRRDPSRLEPILDFSFSAAMKRLHETRLTHYFDFDKEHL